MNCPKCHNDDLTTWAPAGGSPSYMCRTCGHYWWAGDRGGGELGACRRNLDAVSLVGEAVKDGLEDKISLQSAIIQVQAELVEALQKLIEVEQDIIWINNAPRRAKGPLDFRMGMTSRRNAALAAVNSARVRLEEVQHG